MMKLYDYILQTAHAALPLQKEDGSMPPGHNGLKMDPETPVRNTAEWSMIFLHAFSSTKEEKFKKAAIACLNYLFSKDARPHSKTFWFRTNPKKDKCNGIMGQVFPLDALYYAYQKTKEQRYQDLATKVFSMIPFNPKTGLWKKVEIDGKVGYFDLTFNHQLWFAAVNSQSQNSEVLKKVEIFLDRLEDNVKLRENGLIVHELFLNKDILQISINFLSRMYLKFKRTKEKQQEKEMIYHSYNLYALALLKTTFPNHPFWKSQKFKKSLSLLEDKSFTNHIIQNKEKYWSGLIGIENSYALQTFFKGKEKEITMWLKEEIQYHFDQDTKLLNKNALDKNTVATRFYEAVRLKNYDIE